MNIFSNKYIYKKMFLMKAYLFVSLILLILYIIWLFDVFSVPNQFWLFWSCYQGVAIHFYIKLMLFRCPCCDKRFHIEDVPPHFFLMKLFFTYFHPLVFKCLHCEFSLRDQVKEDGN